VDPVTAVLLDRAHDGQGLRKMLTVSTAAHLGLIAAVVVVPAILGTRRADDVRPVMTISLGSAPGPRAGGVALEGRPASTRPATLPDAKRPAPLRAESPRPAMILPTPTAKLVSKPAATSVVEPPEAPPRPVSRERVPFGAEATSSDNPARGLGFGGLSTGGMGGAGGYLEISNFCCPDYLDTMLQLVQRNWNAKQGVPGETLLKFQILRDGRITGIELERSSGYAPLDLTAQRALFMTQRVQPLPAAFPDDHLTIHLRFEYHR
jgi:TonB family protein